MRIFLKQYPTGSADTKRGKNQLMMINEVIIDASLIEAFTMKAARVVITMCLFLHPRIKYGAGFEDKQNFCAIRDDYLLRVIFNSKKTNLEGSLYI